MKLKYEIEIVDIGGDQMAIPTNLEDEFYGVLHINNTTQDILEILKNDVTEVQIVAAMKQQYDAAEEDIICNVRKIISILREYNLLIE